MIIISVIVSSDFRGNQGIGNFIEILQVNCYEEQVQVLRFSAEWDGLTQPSCVSLLSVMD